MKKYSLTALILGSGLVLAGTAFAGGPDCDKAGTGGADRFNRLDRNKDGKVTLPELTEAREEWLGTVDGNKDGVATRAEIQASQQARHTERIGRMFQRKDANADGRLTREESRMPEAWFAKADGNRDGALTQVELAQSPAPSKHGGAGLHQPGGAGRGRRMDHNRMDHNGDGKIEREEVRKAAALTHERLDRNADGSLTSDELGKRGGKGHGKGRQGPNSKGTQRKAPPAAPKAS